MISIRIVTIEHPVSKLELRDMAAAGFGDMVKAVVDIEKNTIAIGGELHADEEEILLEHGSSQRDLWGINLYPHKPGPEWLEYDSMINIRPSQGNRSRSVEDPAVREKIAAVVNRLVS